MIASLVVAAGALILAALTLVYPVTAERNDRLRSSDAPRLR
jgi:hypothetical protein